MMNLRTHHKTQFKIISRCNKCGTCLRVHAYIHNDSVCVCVCDLNVDMSCVSFIHYLLTLCLLKENTFWVFFYYLFNIDILKCRVQKAKRCLMFLCEM